MLRSILLAAVLGFAPSATAATLEPVLPFTPAEENPDPRFFPREVHLGIRMASRASWYGPGFIGNRTANGEIYTGRSMTAAHKSLPFGTRVRVTNRNTGRSVVVRINDRGPFVPGRSIDLSVAAAERLGIIGSGTAPVRLEILN